MKGHHSVLYCPLRMYCRATQRQLFVRKSFCGKVLELVLIKFYTRNGSSLKNPIFLFLDAIFVFLTNFPAGKELKMEKMLSHIFIGSMLLCWCIMIHELHYGMTKQKITSRGLYWRECGLRKKLWSDWRWASGYISKQFLFERHKGNKEDFKSCQKWHCSRCLL